MPNLLAKVGAWRIMYRPNHEDGFKAFLTEACSESFSLENLFKETNAERQTSKETTRK